MRLAVVITLLLAALAWFYSARSIDAPRTPYASRRTPQPASNAHPRAALPSVVPDVVASLPRRLAALGWGKGAEQVGRRSEPESAHEGPMAIALGRDGSLFILDQVNGRVLRREANGSFAAPIAVRATAQDIRADGAGIAVLDRLGAQTLQRFDRDGRSLEERPLSAYGVAQAGGTTGLFDDAEGALFIEESLAGQGRRVVHGLSGEVLAGRPSHGSDSLVTAAITQRAAGDLEVRGMARDGTVRFTSPLSVGRAILSIALVDPDREGRIYVGVIDAVQEGPDATDEQLDLFRLSEDGALMARTSVTHRPSELERFRELAVGESGVVTWMHPMPDDSGMAIDQIAF